MKGIVTEIHHDGMRLGWPGRAVFRYRGEDGSWAWIPQPSKHHAVGDIIALDGGWEWLDANKRRARLAALKRLTDAERTAALRAATAKTPAQLAREIDETLAARSPAVARRRRP